MEWESEDLLELMSLVLRRLIDNLGTNLLFNHC